VTLVAIQAELSRARAKFPGNRFLLAALVEEVGELAEAIAHGDREAIRMEAVQVACVAVRIAEEGDATTYPKGAVTILDLAVALGYVAQRLLQKRNPRTVLDMLREKCIDMYRAGDPTFADITDAESKA
jgi:hypothetical protein